MSTIETNKGKIIFLSDKASQAEIYHISDRDKEAQGSLNEIIKTIKDLINNITNQTVETYDSDDKTKPIYKSELGYSQIKHYLPKDKDWRLDFHERSYQLAQQRQDATIKTLSEAIGIISKFI